LIFKLLDELLLMAPVTAATTAAVFYACSLQGSFLLFWLVHLATLANGTGEQLVDVHNEQPVCSWGTRQHRFSRVLIVTLGANILVRSGGQQFNPCEEWRPAI
jgi:hypothetical protein